MSSKVPGVKPVTWRGTFSTSMPLEASIRSSVVSLVPPSEGMPMRLPTKSCGLASGFLLLSDTTANVERRPVKATLCSGAPWLAMSITDSSQPTHESSAVPLRMAWIAGAEPRAVFALTVRPSFLKKPSMSAMYSAA